MRMILLITAIGLTGCSGSSTTQNAGNNGGGNPDASSKLVGNWEGQEKPTVTVNGKEVEANGDPVTIRFEFRADETMSLDLGLFVVSGTWKTTKVEGNKWTVATEMNVPSGEFGIESKDGKTTTKTDSKMEKEKDTLTITFETDDRIVVDSARDAGKPLKMQRKK